ncbi:protein FLUORESCENT IN BLUE LIGHT, chloroplastic-like [Prosopis cineraria]|uniref:protein FLUORESCENT IN BLUE LIGHT, chloroplastic-like n=1 Tax=Prosopis cineraria TaxID=364024 RepID=UPI00240EE170|nr:protein FLUORESCENT IN BLUE LIGHT, chloroplastic-like [Prosopis cineraria]
MTRVLHCSCFLTRPRLRQPVPGDQFSRNQLNGPGKLACPSFKVKKFVRHRKDTFHGHPEIQSVLSYSNCQVRWKTWTKVALIGATVGGLLARQRRGELKRLNDQLRQINAALRRQAKVESYAPSLSYAPIGCRISENEVIVDSRKQDLISKLKKGKNFLRNQEPDKAFKEFETALELAQNLKDPIEEKKATRGLGASLQRQGKYREAIKYHSMVLSISEREGEESGNTEAYGAIADCYTELGDLERAGQFYDMYIARFERLILNHSHVQHFLISRRVCDCRIAVRVP